MKGIERDEEKQPAPENVPFVQPAANLKTRFQVKQQRQPKTKPKESLIQQVKVDLQQEEGLPAVGVRCLFCDRPAKRISRATNNSNNIVRKSMLQRQPQKQALPRRPQTARERPSRSAYPGNYTTNHEGNAKMKQSNINVKIMDGIVAPPPIRRSFRVSGLVAK